MAFPNQDEDVLDVCRATAAFPLEDGNRCHTKAGEPDDIPLGAGALLLGACLPYAAFGHAVGLLFAYPAMNHYHVACAIIEQGGNVLATQRSESMSLPLKWEFPGGKIKDGESASACLKRELREELGIEITVGPPLTSTTHSYRAFTVTLYPFRCRIVAGVITLHEHAALVWLPPAELHTLDWAEADLLVIDQYRRSAGLPGGR